MGYDGTVTIKISADTKSFEEEINQTEIYLNKLVKSYETAANMKGKLKPNEQAMANLRKEIEKTNNKLIDLREKQNNVSQGGMPKLKDIMEDINKSTTKTIQKIGRWALAVFGIRGAYMAVRNAINIISQDDQKLASDIEYMRRALAYTIEPIVRVIVNLMQQLMNYVAYIVKSWTGRNIFESANKSLKNANNNAKKLSKTLAGFDEMNVLNDSDNSGLSGVELPTLEDSKVPSWLEWIAQNKDLVIAGLAGITAGLIGMKFGLDAIQTSGIILFISGIVYTIAQLIEYFSLLDGSLETNGTSFNLFGNIIAGIGVALLGLSIAIASVPLAIGAAITLAIGLLIKFWDEIKSGLQIAIDWISSKMNWIQENFGVVGLAIVGIFQGIIEIVLHLFDGLFTGIKQIFDGILLIFKGNFKQGFINIGKGIVNAVIGILNGLISAINTIVSPIRALIVGIGTVLGKKFTMDNIKIPTIPKLAVGGIVNMPGRGVPIGGAIGGERGPEGVIPLTNSQMMAQLGETIGRYVTINANITNTMNGRIISRELQKINNNSDFARNS